MRQYSSDFCREIIKNEHNLKCWFIGKKFLRSLNDNADFSTIVEITKTIRKMNTTVDSKFSSLISYLRKYLVNHTLSYNESDFQVVLTFINKTKPTIPIRISTQNRFSCGDTFQELAEIYAKFYHLTVALIICSLGTVSNTLNVIVLTQKEMISTPINRILTSLAITDVLIMLEYIPYVFYHYHVLPKHMDFPFVGAVYMLFHGHFTQILHTTSICLTLMLAVWRFLALRYPQKQQVWCTHFRCTVGLTTSFLLPIVLCLPTYFTITIVPQRIEENSSNFTLYHTDLSETLRTDTTALKLNFWIYSVFIKLLPCGILTFITLWLIRTLILANRRKRNFRNQGVVNDNHRAAKNEKRAERTTKMLITVLIFFLVAEFPQGIFSFMIGWKGRNLFLKCYQIYGEIMDILALFSGSVNFILYCSMNRMFRTTFGDLFKKKIVNWGLMLSARIRMVQREEVQIEETEN